MKVRTLGSLLVAVIVAGIALSMPAAVDAQAPPVPPNTCTITAGTNTIDVTTIPSSAQAGFPALVDCPAAAAPTLTGECLEWSYQFTNRNEGSISLAGATASANIAAVVASAGNPESFAAATVFPVGAGDTTLGLARNVFDVRAIRFSTPGSTIFGNIYTPVNVATGQVTVAAKVSNLLGFCGIAGPANLVPGGTGKTAITTTIISQAGKCTVARTVDSNGCTVALDASQATFPNNPENCDTSTNNVTIDSGEGQQTGVGCTTQITFGSGTRYCFANAFGGLSCITSP
jgi:hypothetical protein